jgi:hypothetical protein
MVWTKLAFPHISTFALPRDYDFLARNDGTYFGGYSGDEKQRFAIRFHGDAILRVKERRWAKDQTLTEADGTLTVTFTSTQYGKVLEWVLSSGKYAEPLAPPALVAEWQDHVAGAHEKCR